MLKSLVTASVCTCFALAIQTAHAQILVEDAFGRVVVPGGMVHPASPVVYPSIPQGVILNSGERITHINGVPVNVATSVSHPWAVTPNRISGVNLQTGGLNTSNTQINNTVFDPYRDASRNNGTQRWVRRPVYNPSGRVIGYQQGYVWNNSITGAEHTDGLQTHTPNQLNGQHRQRVITSGRFSNR